jgi:hypothetical protein
MLLDGNSNTQHHLLEQENFCGKKDIQLMLMKKMHLNSLDPFLIFMQILMSTLWQFLAAKEENLKMKLSLELTFLRLLKFMFHNQEEESKEQHPIN